MKKIKAGYRRITEQNPAKKIELVARVCYKSEDKITEGSAAKMIENLLTRKHYAMLEHASIIMEVNRLAYNNLKHGANHMQSNAIQNDDMAKCFLRFTKSEAYPYWYNETFEKSNTPYNRYLVSGNVRAWLEYALYASRNDDVILSKQCYEKLMYAVPEVFSNDIVRSQINMVKTYGPEYVIFDDGVHDLTPGEQLVHWDETVLFICDRGVTHELVRMRDCSFAQESTRYCNYSLGKFGEEITVIEPLFYLEPGREDEYNAWVSSMEDAEKHYFDLIHAGSKSQEARDVLPNSIKSDIVMTANLNEWHHIFDLRACDGTGPAHPQMREIMVPYFKEMRSELQCAFNDLVLPEER